jgi:dihydrofolate reductase
MSQLLKVHCFTQPKEAADDKDVRLGGGVTTIRGFLDANLVDTMHIAVAPIEIGRGERLWTSPDELLDRFHLDTGAEPQRGDAPPVLAPLIRRVSFDHGR